MFTLIRIIAAAAFLLAAGAGETRSSAAAYALGSSHGYAPAANRFAQHSPASAGCAGTGPFLPSLRPLGIETPPLGLSSRAPLRAMELFGRSTARVWSGYRQ